MLKQQPDGTLSWSEGTKVDADAWYFERAADGRYRIVHAADGKALNTAPLTP